MRHKHTTAQERKELKKDNTISLSKLNEDEKKQFEDYWSKYYDAEYAKKMVKNY